MRRPVADEERTPRWGAALRLGIAMLAMRWGILLLLAWLAYLLPWPMVTEALPLKDVLIVALAVIGMGKALYDTLFFDRYWPWAR